MSDTLLSALRSRFTTRPTKADAAIAEAALRSDRFRQEREPDWQRLEAIVTALFEYYGWDGLAVRIPVNCFINDPSIKSSLKFLRKTPWARDKAEALYLGMKQRKS